MRQSTPHVDGEYLKIGGVASAAIADLLHEPGRPAELIGSYPAAVYVRSSGGIAALVSSEGVRLPNAIVLPPASHAGIVRHARSGPIRVGDGGVRVGPVLVTAGRWWDPVPRLGRVNADLLAGRLSTVSAMLPAWPDAADPAAGRLRAGRVALASVLAGAEDLVGTVRRLVGLGAGLTPAGDDLLAGAVAGLVVFGTALDEPEPVAMAERLAGAVLEQSAATTPLAADLAAHAARGALVQPAAELCRALADRRPGAERTLEPALERLLRIGHTSGRDLAEGMRLGASTALSWVGNQALLFGVTRPDS